MPEVYLPKTENERRLPGIDGKAKMSKSLGNTIYLADTSEEVKRKVMSMYTDPNHIRVDDPGSIEGNVVFTYLDVFAKDEHFSKYLPEYKNLDELKKKYQAGGLGDVVIKKFLNDILQEVLEPIREKRKYYENHLDEVVNILEKGTEEARKRASRTLEKVKSSMKINYFKNDDFLNEAIDKYK